MIHKGTSIISCDKREITIISSGSRVKQKKKFAHIFRECRGPPVCLAGRKMRGSVKRGVPFGLYFPGFAYFRVLWLLYVLALREWRMISISLGGRRKFSNFALGSFVEGHYAFETGEAC